MTFAAPASGALRAACAVGALLVVALVVGASSIGPASVLGGDGDGDGASQVVVDRTDTGGPLSGGTLGRLLSASSPDQPAGWPRGLGLAFEALAVLGLGWLGWRILARLLIRRDGRSAPAPRPEPEAPEPTDETAGPPSARRPTTTSPAVAGGAVTGTGSAGTPRNAVVVCWHELELDATRVGIAPRRWQTPSEFARAVLERSTVDAGAVRDLAELYRRARFSEHPITPADLDRAREALATARGSLAPTAPGAGR